MVDLTPTDFLSGLGGLANLPHPYDDQQQVIGDQQRTQQNANVLTQQAQAINAVQQKQQQAQQYQTDVAAALKNPSPQNFAALYAKYPEQHDALKASWDAQDAPTKQANLTQLGSVFTYLNKGRSDLAAKSIQSRIDAEKAAGLDTSDDEQVLALVTSGKPEDLETAKGITGMHLSAAVGTDKYDETLKTLGIDSGDKTRVVHAGDIVLGPDNKPIYTAPDKKPEPYHYTLKDANGVEHEFVDYGDGAPQPTGNNTTTGGVGGTLPTSLPGIVDRIARIEGTGQNPNSSSLGVGQFTNGTWLDTYKKANPNSGMTDAQILAQRTNPTVARQMLSNLVQSNAQTLQAGGIAPTADNIYVANFLGPSGAIRALTASPDTPISQIATPKQIAANPTTLGKFQNVGQLRQWAAGKMAGGVPNSGASLTPGQSSSGGPRQLDNTPFATEVGGNSLIPDNLSGDDALAYLQHKSPGIGNRVAGIMAGKIPYPNATRKDTQPILNAISQIDPSFDATKWKARNETSAQYAAGGAAGKVLASGATAVSHLYDLALAAQKLPDHYLGFMNSLDNDTAAVGSDTGKNLIQFNRSRTLYAPEVAKYLAGTGQAAEGEVNKHYNSFNPSLGRTGNLNNLVTDTKFITDKFDAQAAAYQQTMGKPLAIDGQDKTTGPVTAKLAALRWWADNQSKPVPVVITSPLLAKKLPKGTVVATPDGRIGTVK